MSFKFTYFTLLLLFLSMNELAAQVNLQSSNLPIIVINTNYSIVDEPKRPATMGIIYNDNNQRNQITDPFNHYNGDIGIEWRGQSSQWFFDKRSYGIETRNQAEEALNVSLLGLPEENDWILYAPFSDKTMMRNVLIYQLSNEAGQYASRTRYCELVLNGDYKGVFVLMEKIKRDKNRLDIAKLKPEETTGEDLTGGYIVRLDKYDVYDQNIWASTFSDPNIRMEYQVVYPRPKNLQTAQFDYIKQFIYDFETALTSEAYKDPLEGYRKYIDVESFVDFLLLNELGRNPDAYRISTYFYKENDRDGGKLKMGPIWDFNIAMGNADFCMAGGHQNWILNYNQTCPDDFWLIGYWWDRLLTDEYFLNKVAARWIELRQTAFKLTNIYSIIDEKAQLLQEAQERNFDRWDILNSYVWPNPHIGGSYSSEVKYLKDWFSNRVRWMDENIELIGGQVKGKYSSANAKVYPNPMGEELYIEFQQEVQGIDLQFNMYNSLGQLVVTSQLEPSYGVKSKFRIPRTTVRSLPSGIYFYNLVINKEIALKGKLLKE